MSSVFFNYPKKYVTKSLKLESKKSLLENQQLTLAQ